MCNNKSCSFNACGVLGIIISILFGVAVGLLFAMGLIPNIVVSVWIAFGIGILALIFLVASVLTASSGGSHALVKCLCSNASCLLAGIIGTIISTIIALSIVLVPTTLVAVIVGIVAFFFSLMILGIIALISCIVDKMCCS